MWLYYSDCNAQALSATDLRQTHDGSRRIENVRSLSSAPGKHLDLLVGKACWNVRMVCKVLFVWFFCMGFLFCFNRKCQAQVTLDFGFCFFKYFKNSSYLFSMKHIGNLKSLQHFLIIEKFFLGGGAGSRTYSDFLCSSVWARTFLLWCSIWKYNWGKSGM